MGDEDRLRGERERALRSKERFAADAEARGGGRKKGAKDARVCVQACRWDV